MPLIFLLLDDAATLLRWLHVVAAMVWVGSAFALARLDLGMRPCESDPRPQSLLLHAGAGFRFSRAEQADAEEPPLNFKWEAYATWASGFALICLIFCASPRLYLIDPQLWDAPGWAANALALALLPLAWLAYDVLCKRSGLRGDNLLAALLVFAAALALALTCVFAGRGAWMLLGAILATLMAANIAHAIVPAQRRRLLSLREGRAADPADAQFAASRALHNQYLALPVVFFMLSGHAPLLFAGAHNGGAAMLFLAAGFAIRRFFLQRARRLGSDWRLAGAAAGLIGLALILSAPRALPEDHAAVESAGQAIALVLHSGPAEAQTIIERHCVLCHAARPEFEGLFRAPAGLDLQDLGKLERFRATILRVSVYSNAMPPPGAAAPLDLNEKQALLRWAQAVR
jgi:uncharacterized membrane protein